MSMEDFPQHNDCQNAGRELAIDNWILPKLTLYLL